MQASFSPVLNFAGPAAGTDLSTQTPSPTTAPAALWRRLAAFAYDLLLLAALFVCFTLAVLAVRRGAAVPAGSWWFPLCLFAIATAFFTGFWVHGGQTVGMRAWRIRVVCEDGGPLPWPRAAARFGAALIAALPAGLGILWSAFDGHGRGWHDLWTRTRVERIDAARRD
jgi:uncharacterized RDD family membrane protein YckC